MIALTYDNDNFVDAEILDLVGDIEAAAKIGEIVGTAAAAIHDLYEEHKAAKLERDASIANIGFEANYDKSRDHESGREGNWNHDQQTGQGAWSTGGSMADRNRGGTNSYAGKNGGTQNFH